MTLEEWAEQVVQVSETEHHGGLVVMLGSLLVERQRRMTREDAETVARIAREWLVRSARAAGIGGS